jgi:hypothetical protein
MCHVLYDSMRVLHLADQQTVQTDQMLIKWLPDCEKKSTELLRDTSLGQVMTNCDTDIDWGSNKEEIVSNEDNDEESDDDDSSLEIDDKEDSKDDDMAFDFSGPEQVSF